MRLGATQLYRPAYWVYRLASCSGFLHGAAACVSNLTVPCVGLSFSATLATTLIEDVIYTPDVLKFGDLIEGSMFWYRCSAMTKSQSYGKIGERHRLAS